VLIGKKLHRCKDQQREKNTNEKKGGPADERDETKKGEKRLRLIDETSKSNHVFENQTNCVSWLKILDLSLDENTRNQCMGDTKQDLCHSPPQASKTQRRSQEAIKNHKSVVILNWRC
jgi:hypothetical protein